MKKEVFPVVNVIFKDDTELFRCAIFEDINNKSQPSITNEKRIEEKFQKLPWYPIGDGLIYFQNRYINGCFHVENVRSYEIVYVTNEEF